MTIKEFMAKQEPNNKNTYKIGGSSAWFFIGTFQEYNDMIDKIVKTEIKNTTNYIQDLGIRLSKNPPKGKRQELEFIRARATETKEKWKDYHNVKIIDIYKCGDPNSYGIVLDFNHKGRFWLKGEFDRYYGINGCVQFKR